MSADRIKPGDTFDVFGHKVRQDRENRSSVVRETIDLDKSGDHGCDPLPDGTFRMVPSGDIVNREEMERRLA